MMMLLFFDICLGAITLAIIYVLWSLGYSAYKHRQWTINNPDEWINLESIRRGFKKDPGKQ